MPLLNDAKTCYVGTTPITKVMAGSVQVWPLVSLVSGKPYPTNAYIYPESDPPAITYPTYFLYDVPDLKLWSTIYDPEIEENIRFPVYDPAINKKPSGDVIVLDRSVWYLGKREEFGKIIYSYRSRSEDKPTAEPPPVKYNYTVTINGIVSDVAEADLHWP